MAGPMFSAKVEQQSPVEAGTTRAKQTADSRLHPIGRGFQPLQRKTAGAYMLGFSSYNFQHFSREILQEHSSQASFAGPEPGERAPDFKAETLDGERVRLSDFHG